MTWQVAIDASNRLVIGIGTEPDNNFPAGTDFGPEYPIVTIADDAELAVLLAPTDPAWLSLDSEHILAQPPR